MCQQDSPTGKGYSLVETVRGSGVFLLHVVLGQLATRPFKNNVRHNGDCQHHDHVDKLVDDNLPDRRGD